MKNTHLKSFEGDPSRQYENERYNSIYNTRFKRIFDLFFAIIFLILLIPVFILIAVGIVAETGFPVLYKAKRGGYKGTSFNIYKFRTMVRNADKIGGGTTALNDPRITRVGRILRQTKLDEITQFFNIIKGDMSFIGPRPELLHYTTQYSGREHTILNVRPGLTDYSSLTFIDLDEIVGEADADEMYEKYVLTKKNQLRMKYAATVSVRTDLYLFFNTVWRVLQKMIKLIVKNKC